MASELIASYRSSSLNITSFQASGQRQAVALQVGQGGGGQDIFNSQQQQIVDEISLSQEAQRQLQDGQALLDYLQTYIDRLKGRYKEDLLSPPENNDKNNTVTLNARSTDLAASISVASYEENTFEVAASFNDDGKLDSLTITQTQTQVEAVHTQAILQDRQFFATDVA